MSRMTIFVTENNDTEKFNLEWQLVDDWIARWKDKMAVCSDQFDGCGCCFVSWDVDAPQEALNELPPHLLSGSW